MTIYSFLGLASVVLEIIAYILYVISIYQRKTFPNKATWIIWTVLSGVLAFSSLAKSAPNTIWLPFIYFLVSLLIVILTYCYGSSKWNRIDKICLLLAALSLIPCILFRDPSLTILINVAIEAIGGIPTIIKTYRKPDSEEFLSWFIFFMSTVLKICVIQHWNITAVYPIFLFFLSGIIVALSR